MGRDALSTRIRAIDKKLVETSIKAEERSIFKVHEKLLKVNEKAYKPVLLAIGPYNDHKKVGHGLMEEHKLRYLKQMLKRKNESSVEAYISALTELEESARNCYAERIRLTTYDFVEMMLLDCCFIIELFRKWEKPDIRDDPHDPIFQLDWMLPKIARDLLLFENQLPFFVLTRLFLMIESSQTPLPNQSEHLGEHPIKNEQSNEITCPESSTTIDQSVQIRLFGDLALRFLYRAGSLPFQWKDVSGPSSYSAENIEHLLGLPHTTISPTLARLENERQNVGDKFKKLEFKHLLDLIYTSIKLSVLDMEVDRAIERQDQVGVLEKIFGLIPCVVSSLLAKIKNMNKGYKKMNEDDDWNDNRWERIPDAIAFQEAGVELDKAEKFKTPLQQNRNKDVKKNLCGARFKMAEKFTDTKKMMRSIDSATKLKEGGVKFQKAKQDTMFSVNFSNGVLEISPLRIQDETETFLRNLIAYEQYSPDIDTDYHYVTLYACFMDDLINSPEDVELLRHNEIIENWLGDDGVVSRMFNKLGRHVTVSEYPHSTLYAQTCIDMNKHCAEDWNEWMATLRRNYFNSPWALLSVLAAILLLGLTIIQTVFSIIN